MLYGHARLVVDVLVLAVPGTALLFHFSFCQLVTHIANYFSADDSEFVRDLLVVSCTYC
jgi:hypothetical protein